MISWNPYTAEKMLNMKKAIPVILSPFDYRYIDITSLILEALRAFLEYYRKKEKATEKDKVFIVERICQAFD